MESSILKQSQKAKTWKKYLKIVIVPALLLAIWFFFFGASTDTNSTNNIPEILTVETGDIVISVEGEGKVINPNIVNLSFLINGTLKDVNVEQGDMVQAGDLVATLDQRDLNFDLKDAQSRVNVAWANIKAKQAELTDQSLRLAQDDVISSKQTLQNNLREFQQSVDQSYDSAIANIENTFPKIESGLRSVDQIFSFDRQLSPFQNVLHAFNDNIRENSIRNFYQSAKRNRDNLWDEYQSLRGSRGPQIESFLVNIKHLLLETQDLLEETMILFDGAVPSTYANQSLIDSAESQVMSSLGNIGSELNTITSAKQKIQDAVLNQKNGTANSQRSLENTALKLENSQRDYQRIKTSKESSLSVLYAQLEQAQLGVEKARYNLGLTSLSAPIDGEIVIVNGKPGETIKADNASSENAFVRILSTEHFTTEVYIEEVDIAKIEEGQATKITLDALEDTELEGEVTYVSSTSTIDNNGITTYLVRVKMLDTDDIPVREGMTTYVEFIQHQALSSIIVPSSAIADERAVFDENGERIRVRIGISDGTLTEIHEGLEVGQKIMARAPGGSESRGAERGNGERRGANMSDDERMERVGERLKENGSLPDGWDKMSTAQKQKALEAMRESGGFGGFGGGQRPGGGGGRGGGGGGRSR